MKVSSRQKSSSELISLAISQVYELTMASSKSIEKTFKWFHQCNTYMKRIEEVSSQLKKEDKKMHVMLNETSTKTMEACENSASKVLKILSTVLVSKSETYAQQCANDIAQINTQLKQTLAQMCDLYEEFYLDTKHPISTTVADCTQSGFDVHCAYLRYSKGIDEFEIQFRESFSLLKEIDKKMVLFEHSFWNGINEIFNMYIPHASRAPPAPPIKYHDEEFAKIMATFQVGFQGFRMPTAHYLPCYNFEAIPVKMRAKKVFDGKKVGEISISENEIVDVIDTSLAEWYKVRLANGMEGYVPVNVLAPIPPK
jgi:hypothetical protein